jgi:hypothetical protein
LAASVWLSNVAYHFIVENLAAIIALLVGDRTEEILFGNSPPIKRERPADVNWKIDLRPDRKKYFHAITDRCFPRIMASLALSPKLPRLRNQKTQPREAIVHRAHPQCFGLL